MTDGEPETVVLASLQKIKSIKNPIKLFFFFFFFFFKSETSDLFVSHFDGHFAYLKTLDFSFKKATGSDKTVDLCHDYSMSRRACRFFRISMSILPKQLFLLASIPNAGLSWYTRGHVALLRLSQNQIRRTSPVVKSSDDCFDLSWRHQRL